MIFVVVSTGHFDSLIAECSKLSSRYQFLGQIGSSTVVPNFEYFRTAPPSEIESNMRKAELVISHGGAGMTSMLYRLKKPSVIIPKQVRYGEANNLQVELAQKWGELGTTVLCMDVSDLGACIEKAKTFPFRFPPFPPLGEHMRQEVGLSQTAFPLPSKVAGY